MRVTAPFENVGTAGPAGCDTQANRVSELTFCCTMLFAELMRLPPSLRPRISKKVVMLAEKNGVDVAPLRRRGSEESRKANRTSGLEMVRKMMGERSTVELGPRMGMTTVTFELVAVDTYRVRMPNFWAVYKDGRWHRGPGILSPGAKLEEEEVTKKVNEVMKSVRLGTILVLSDTAA